MKRRSLLSMGTLVGCSLLALTTGMGLTGCGQTEQSCLGETVTLRGRISNWTLGSGHSIELPGDWAAPPLATAPIEADGSFSLALPPMHREENYLPAWIYSMPPLGYGWTVSGTVDVKPDPMALRFAPAGFSVMQESHRKWVRIRDVSQPDDPSYRLALVSYSQDSSISGHLTGRRDRDGKLMDTRFAVESCRGWNWELWHQTDNFNFEVSTAASVMPEYSLEE